MSDVHIDNLTGGISNVLVNNNIVFLFLSLSYTIHSKLRCLDLVHRIQESLANAKVSARQPHLALAGLSSFAQPLLPPKNAK